MATSCTYSDDSELDDSSFYEEKSRKNSNIKMLKKAGGKSGSSVENAGKKRGLEDKSKSKNAKTTKNARTNQDTPPSLPDSSYSESSDSEGSDYPNNPTPSMDCDDDWEEDVYLARIQNLHGAQAPPSPYLVTTPYNTKVCAEVWDRLYPYQKEGCGWMYGLYREGVGGILADEMGLGKTAQVCTHFGSLCMTLPPEPNRTPIFLIVCPATVLHHWVQEMHTWCPHMRTCVLHAISQTGKEMCMLDGKDMEVVLKKMIRKRGLHTHTIHHNIENADENEPVAPITTVNSGITIITTYDTLRRHHACLSLLEYTGVCLDEGQKIRNHHTQLHDVCIHLPSYHRIILSGTPIQNSLLELWSLFRFVYPTRLGDVTTFEQCMCKPIREGGYVNASRLQIRIGIECAITLQNIVKPYLLRRRKDMVHLNIQLPKKTEHVIFVQLSQWQRKIYHEVLESDEVYRVLAYRSPAFRAINTLRKLCNHPVLVYRHGKIQWQQEDAYSDPPCALVNAEDEMYEHKASASHTRCHSVYAQEGARDWKDSGKLVVLHRVLTQWQGKQGNKVLIFCQTVAVLDIIECLLRQEKYTYLRLDGGTPIQHRARYIYQFNNDAGVFIMLLTTRTGGLGVSLTAANKVILFDPDWNPQTDIQARERAYRLGQQRDVTVYRLICQGTIEEKIYERQIDKLILSNKILHNAKEKGRFAKSILKLLFTLDEGAMAGGAGVLPDAGRVSIENDDHDKGAEGDDIKHGEGEWEGEGVLGMREEDMGNVELLRARRREREEARKKLLAEDESDDVKEDDDELAEQRKDDGGEERQDRLILQALFEGGNVGGVYNHAYLETAGRDRDEEEREARILAQRNVQKVQASSLNRNPNLPSISSNLYPPNRFAASSAVGGMGMGTMGGATASSALILARLRGGVSTDGQASNAVPGTISNSTTVVSSDGAVNSKGVSLLTQYRKEPTSTSLKRSTGNSGNVTGLGTGSENKTDDITQSIRSRLFALFQSNSQQGVATTTLLLHFSDLGDQYAPLFKRVLKDIARVKEGVWSLKECAM